jgi:hypothetical protein
MAWLEERTGRHSGVVDAHEPILDGNHARAHIGDHFRDQEWIVARGAVAFHIILNFFFQGVQTANARSPNHASTLFSMASRSKAGVFQGLVGRHERELGEAVNTAYFFAIHKILGDKTLHLTGKLGFEQAGIKLRDGACAACAALQPSKKAGMLLPMGVIAPMPVTTTRFIMSILS